MVKPFGLAPVNGVTIGASKLGRTAFGANLRGGALALSVGEAQKLTILMALGHEPDLLVLDEPFTGLDPLVRDEVIGGLLEVTEQERWTVFISSHDIDEVERLSDWVGILNAGKIYLSESAVSLQARFRRLEGVVASAAKLPARLPGSWLAPEITPHQISMTIPITVVAAMILTALSLDSGIPRRF